MLLRKTDSTFLFRCPCSSMRSNSIHRLVFLLIRLSTTLCAVLYRSDRETPFFSAIRSSAAGAGRSPCRVESAFRLQQKALHRAYGYLYTFRQNPRFRYRHRAALHCIVAHYTQYGKSHETDRSLCSLPAFGPVGRRAAPLRCCCASKRSLLYATVRPGGPAPVGEKTPTGESRPCADTSNRRLFSSAASFSE